MSDRPTPKTGRTRNDSRPNGKANKGGRARGARKSAMDPLQRALMGQGVMRTFRPVPGDPWVGVSSVPVPFNRAQVEENKSLYPHLFPSNG